MNIRKIIFLILAAVLIAAPAAAESWPHERDGFTIGFNIGGGNASTKPDGGEGSSGGGGAGSFRLGWAFSNQFLVGLESTAWVGATDAGSDLTLMSNLINFTWYPGAKGWLLRAGFGWGEAEVSTDFFGSKVSVSETGSAFGLGAGHEWRLTRKFALGLAVDYATLGLDDVNFDYVNFTAQFNWYF